MMKAVILEQFGPIDNLKMRDVPIPTPGEGQVLVKLSAISINPIDVKTRIGSGAATIFPVSLPLVLGWDLSGTVVSCGPGVNQWKKGDEVFGSVNFPGFGQTYAEYALVTASHLARKPPSISHEQAAAASMAGLTAWQGLTPYLSKKAGQRILIHAAAGGVGHMVVQMAKSFGLYVIGTSSAINRDFVLSLGADEHIDYRKVPFQKVVSDVDFVFDAVGGDTAVDSLSVLKEGGSLVSILSLHESIASKALAKNIQAHFVLMNSNSADMTEVAKLLGNQTIAAHISHTFSSAQTGEAHTLLETGRMVGKIVLTL